MAIEVPEFKGHGRTLVVEFKCYRCKKTAYRPLENCRPSEHNIRGMHDLIPPAEWEDGGFYYPLFCPDCSAAHKRFMNMEE